jgi:TDG/mug DNA glycosylase family protein
VAVLGKGAYRKAFRRPKAEFGPQEEELAGVRLWLLPNPSGLNAYYQPPVLAELFRELREAARGRGKRAD